MTTPAYIIAQHLESVGFGTIGAESGEAIFISREPDEPSEVLTVYDTGGENPDTFDQDLFRNTIQIRVKSDNYLTGYEKQKNIRLELLASVNQVSGIIRAFQIGGINDIGTDDKERFLFTTNYSLLME